MTPEQLKSLINYIDAVIDERLDNGQSSDQGLNSTIEKSKALKELEVIFRIE